MSGDGNKRAVALANQNTWLSTDSGATWVENTASPGTTKEWWSGITMSADGTKLQNCLKRMHMNTIPGIQEVNIFQGENVIQFANPKGVYT